VTATGPITLSLVASRLSGVAPLAVFFDATGTTSTSPATTRPFHDLEYRWDFGDPAGSPISGTTWSSGSGAGVSSRNLATGPVTAHVFETPGTYTIGLSVFDGMNTASSSVQVTVANPDAVFAGNTICIGATSSPVPGVGGCPAGASGLQQASFNAAINSSISAGKMRLLFKRGDTFASTSAAGIAVTGPGIIGAFGTPGTGAAPVVNVTGNNNAVKLSGQDTPTIGDWRIMDLEIDGNSGSATNGIYAEGGIKQVTLLRLNIHHVHVGVRFSPFILDSFNGSGHPGHALWDQLALVDTTIQTLIGGSGGNGSYIGAQRFAFMGNVVDDSTSAEHILRLPNIYKGVFSNNTLSNPASAKHTVKMQAAVFGVSPTSFTEQIVFSDNQSSGGAGSAWTVTVGPQDAVENEKVRDVIVERNWFAPHADQQVALMIWAQDVTVRNNLFDLTGTSDHRGGMVDRRGIEPPPANVAFHNNTFYSNSSGNFVPITFAQGSGHVAKNNLGYAPNASGTPPMVSGSATTANNTANVKASPAFVSGSPSVPADFSLAAGSSAINAGTAAPVFSDFFRLDRPQNGGIDLGAIERP